MFFPNITDHFLLAQRQGDLDAGSESFPKMLARLLLHASSEVFSVQPKCVYGFHPARIAPNPGVAKPALRNRNLSLAPF
jgi:hypothetical protein